MIKKNSILLHEIKVSLIKAQEITNTVCDLFILRGIPVEINYLKRIRGRNICFPKGPLSYRYKYVEPDCYGVYSIEGIQLFPNGTNMNTLIHELAHHLYCEKYSTCPIAYIRKDHPKIFFSCFFNIANALAKKRLIPEVDPEKRKDIEGMITSKGNLKKIFRAYEKRYNEAGKYSKFFISRGMIMLSDFKEEVEENYVKYMESRSLMRIIQSKLNKDARIFKKKLGEL